MHTHQGNRNDADPKIDVNMKNIDADVEYMYFCEYTYTDLFVF